MKFTDWYWCNKEGLTVLNPVEIDEIRKDSDSITLYAPCRPKITRFDTVDTAQLTINISSPPTGRAVYQDMALQRCSKKRPEFEINRVSDIRYTELTGRSSLPPAWSFGLWLTTSFTTNYDEGTVNSFVE